jgi:hypothetical protein
MMMMMMMRMRANGQIIIKNAVVHVADDDPIQLAHIWVTEVGGNVEG